MQFYSTDSQESQEEGCFAMAIMLILKTRIFCFNTYVYFPQNRFSASN